MTKADFNKNRMELEKEKENGNENDFDNKAIKDGGGGRGIDDKKKNYNQTFSKKNKYNDLNENVIIDV